MRRHLNWSSNQVSGVNLEEDEGACGFAFPEGGLIPEGAGSLPCLCTRGRGPEAGGGSSPWAMPPELFPPSE